MNPTVRSNLEDSYVEGKTCSICGKQTLQVVHLGAYPDYVNCDSCGSAFVTEDGGERVMYGKIPAAYPDTSRFALQQWVWPEAIERRASAERRPGDSAPVPPPLAASAPEPTPEPPPEESAAPAEPSPPEDVSEQVEATAATEAGWPPAAQSQEETVSDEIRAEGGHPAEEDEDASSVWAPERTLETESEAPSEGESTVVDSTETPEAPAPPESAAVPGVPTEPGTESPAPFGDQGDEDNLLDDLWGDTPEPEPRVAGETEDVAPEAQTEAAPPLPDEEVSATPSWVDDVEEETEEMFPAEPSRMDDAGNGHPTDETPATPSWVDDLDAEADDGETGTTPSWIDEMDAAAADLEAAAEQDTGEASTSAFEAESGEDDFAFPWGETPSEPEQEAAPEDEWAPFGLGAPPESDTGYQQTEEELPEPVSPFEEGDWDDAGLESSVPPPPVEVGQPEETAPPAPPSEDAVGEGAPEKPELASDSDQAEAMATAYWGGQGGPVKKPEPPPEPESDESGQPARYEPTPENRYRVVLKGTKAYFPDEACAHCFYRPAPARLSVLAAITRGAGVGERDITTLRVPVCTECKQRASARSEEQHTAQLQAHLIGVLTGLFLVVCGLAFGLLDLKNSLGAALVGLVVLAALGYVGPAVPLLLRASRMPRPADAEFVASTLRIPGDTESTETAFEWRNERYAHAFLKTNERTAVSEVTRVRASDE